MTTPLLSVLQSQPFASDFSPPQLEKLAALAKSMRFPSQHVFFREGDDCSDFYLILSGMVALEIVAPSRPFRIETLGAGDEFGWSSVLVDQGKLFQARALEDVEALLFQGHELRAMCEQDTSFGYRLLRRLLGVVSQRLQATRLQVLDIYWPDAKRAGA
jgi:CRP-like cAMP-binding protein